MLYFSLALPLRMQVEMQGRQRLRRQHRIPEWSRASAFLYVWQGKQKVPQRPEVKPIREECFILLRLTHSTVTKAVTEGLLPHLDFVVVKLVGLSEVKMMGS